MSDRILQAVATALDAHALRGKRLCIGLSGGADSMVLTDTLDRLRAEYQIGLSALHVNHGISIHADEWQAFCETQCRARGIALEVHRVTVMDEGSGIEAAARELRQRAYSSASADCVALAHHLDDQAETFLLQLLRGAGPKGLAGMPALRDAAEGRAALLRPLLAIRREEIEDHARLRGLAWITDDSNADTKYDRNFLRHEVLPPLGGRFPGYRDTISRTARNMADYLQLADELAALDQDTAVTTKRLRELSGARALNLLRYQFTLHELPMPQRSQLEEALRQCREARPDAQVQIGFGSHALRCYRDRVDLVETADAPPGWQAKWDGRQVLLLPANLGSLHPRPATGAGIALRHFQKQPAIVRGRSGGESLRRAQTGPSRTLKNLMQENAVPPWERSRMPLVFFGDRLAWVPGIGVAAEFRAGAAEAGVEPEWDRDSGSRVSATEPGLS